jgi:hypothetical protein
MELQQGAFGIDKTKALKLRVFSLCESGPLWRPQTPNFIQCAKSNRARFPPPRFSKTTLQHTCRRTSKTS